MLKFNREIKLGNHMVGSDYIAAVSHYHIAERPSVALAQGQPVRHRVRVDPHRRRDQAASVQRPAFQRHREQHHIFIGVDSK